MPLPTLSPTISPTTSPTAGPGSDAPSVTAPKRRRRHRIALAAAVLAAVVVAAGCMNPEQQEGFDLVNESRAAHGLPALAWSPHAHAKAQDWADRLAAAGDLAHSDLRAGFEEVEVQGIAENVAFAGSIPEAQRALMDSPSHRDNILGDYDYLGVGVAHRGDLVYVAQVFVDV